MEKEELKLKVESILFSTGKKISLQELAKLVKQKEEKILEALKELKEKYDKEDSSMMVIEEGDSWKLTVKEKYMDVVQNIVVETELPKAVLETLAVIAFKHPILQAELTKIRTSNVYDHLKILEEAGFIAREKFGRTRKIRLTQKFFDYFDLPADKVKDAFADLDAVEDAIAEKEKEASILLEKIQIQKKEEKERADEDKKKYEAMDIKEEDIPEELGISPAELDTPEVEVYEQKGEKLGKLKVVKSKDTEKKEEDTEDKEEKAEVTEEKEPEALDKTQEEESADNPEDKEYGDKTKKIIDGMNLDEEKKEEKPQEKEEQPKAGRTKYDDEIDKRVEGRVDELLHPESEEDEKNEKDKEEGDESLDKLYDDVEKSRKELDKQ